MRTWPYVGIVEEKGERSQRQLKGSRLNWASTGREEAERKRTKKEPNSECVN